MLHYILAIIGIAFVFDFINGFHDSANSIATIVGTRVLSPLAAVVWAAFFNFVAAFTVGTAVAKTIGQGMIDVAIVTPNVILGGLLGAIIWNLITWWFGLPSSSSHALLGGYAGAAVAKAGFGGDHRGRVDQDDPLHRPLAADRAWSPGSSHDGRSTGPSADVAPHRWMRSSARLQLVSAALFSLSHGANDAQKTMGIIVGLLVSSNALFAHETGWLHHLYLPNGESVPFWVELGAYTRDRARHVVRRVAHRAYDGDAGSPSCARSAGAPPRPQGRSPS